MDGCAVKVRRVRNASFDQVHLQTERVVMVRGAHDNQRPLDVCEGMCARGCVRGT